MGASPAAAISRSIEAICACRLSTMVSSERVARCSSQATAASAMVLARSRARSALPSRTCRRKSEAVLLPSERTVSALPSSSTASEVGVPPSTRRRASASTERLAMAAR